jgi:hypothetical protein
VAHNLNKVPEFLSWLTISVPGDVAISNLSLCPLVVSDQRLTGPTYLLGLSYPQLDHPFRIAQRIAKLESLTYREILARPIPVLHYTLSFSAPNLFNGLMGQIFYWSSQSVNALMKNLFLAAPDRRTGQH